MATPKKRGPYPEERKRGLVLWKKGEPSPNPGGRPRAHRQAVQAVRENMDTILDGMLDIARRHANGEKLTTSDKIASAHYEFLCQFAYGRHAQGPTLTGVGVFDDISDDPCDPDGPSTALLRAVRNEKE